MPSVVVVGTQWGDEGKVKLRTSSAQTQKLLRVTKEETMPVTLLLLTALSTNSTLSPLVFSSQKKHLLSVMV